MADKNNTQDGADVDHQQFHDADEEIAPSGSPSLFKPPLEVKMVIFQLVMFKPSIHFIYPGIKSGSAPDHSTRLSVLDRVVDDSAYRERHGNLRLVCKMVTSLVESAFAYGRSVLRFPMRTAYVSNRTDLICVGNLKSPDFENFCEVISHNGVATLVEDIQEYFASREKVGLFLRDDTSSDIESSIYAGHDSDSSIITELTFEGTWELQPQALARFIDTLPDVKEFCFVFGEESFWSAPPWYKSNPQEWYNACTCIHRPLPASYHRILTMYSSGHSASLDVYHGYRGRYFEVHDSRTGTGCKCPAAPACHCPRVTGCDSPFELRDMTIYYLLESDKNEPALPGSNERFKTMPWRKTLAQRKRIKFTVLFKDHEESVVDDWMLQGVGVD